MKLQQKIAQVIKEYQLFDKTQTLVVGVSGGADSMCLLHVLKEIGCYPLVAVHINHMIRGEDALRDERFVVRQCDELGIPCRVFRKDIPALAREQGIGEEEMGRRTRYECFEHVAAEFNNSVIVVAHHMEDQAETVLFRLIRGTGVSGLGGMQIKNKKNELSHMIVRPLLTSSRAEIESYNQQHRIVFCEDETNQDVTYSRNYMRHVVVPQLKQLNNQAVSHICELAGYARMQHEYIMNQVEMLYQEHVDKERDCLGTLTGYQVIDVAWLCSQPLLIRYELLRMMIAKSTQMQMNLSNTSNGVQEKDAKLLPATFDTGLKDISSEHIRLLDQMVQNGQHNARLDLVGNREAFLSYQKLYVGRELENKVNCENLVNFFHFCDEKTLENRVFSKNNYTEMVDYAKISNVLTMRFGAEQDSIVMDLAGRRKSLARFFIDQKVPKHLRKRIPLVMDGEEIVWVVGYRLNPYYYITKETKRILRLEFDVPNKGHHIE